MPNDDPVLNPVPTTAGSIDAREVVDALPRAVVVSDPDGQILLWSEGAERLYGWTEAEVLGRSVLELFLPIHGQPDNAELLAQTAEGKPWQGDRVVLRRDGEPIRIMASAHPMTDGSGHVRAIVASSEDVTDLRIAQQRANDVSEHLRLALEAGGLGTWRWDMATGETVWDDRLQELFGVATTGFAGTYEAYVELLHPDDRAEVLRTVETAVAEKSSYRVDHRVRWPDGTVHWMAGAGAVTLDANGSATGTIGCVMDVTERAERAHELARLAADAAAAAEGERVQRERVEFFAAIHEALSAAPDRQELMAQVTKAAVPRLGDWCAIHLLVPGEAVPEMEIAHVDPEMMVYARKLQERFPYDPSATVGIPQVIRTGQTDFYPEIDDKVLADLDATEEEVAVIEQLALRSSITVPVVKQGRIFGAMQFVMSSSSRRYTSDDVVLAQAVAGRIAATLENRRLQDLQRDIAETLQRSLLPSSLPDIPGLEVAVRYWPAGEGSTVGGDFYDLFAIDDVSWAVVIGDVCGTGPQAASLTGLTRHTIRDSAWHGDGPIEVLSSLNRAIFRAQTDSFCTAIFGTLAVADGALDLSLACGGHPLPVHLHDGRASTIGTPGSLLGVFEDITGTVDELRLAPGDCVVLYTDGATDLPPPHGLDEAAFTALVERAGGCRSANDLADRIQTELETILPFTRRDDDIALLILRVPESDHDEPHDG